MKKLKSFTLVEIMVTLVIGVLVILLAGSLYTSVLKIHNTSINNYEKNREALSLYFILKQEFSQSEFIYKQYNSVIFRHVDLTESIIEFSENTVVYKRGELTETLRTTCSNMETISLLNDGNYITYLKFDIRLQENFVPMSFFKKYSSRDYVNLNIQLGGN